MRFAWLVNCFASPWLFHPHVMLHSRPFNAATPSIPKSGEVIMLVRKFLREHRASSRDLGGWGLRGGVMLFFIAMGLEKFPNGPGAPWPAIFDQIGLGQWFRYFTGIVEVSGAVLFVLPWTSLVGAGLLSCTMLGAMIVHIGVRHSIGASLFPGVILLVIIAIAFRESD